MTQTPDQDLAQIDRTRSIDPVRDLQENWKRLIAICKDKVDPVEFWGDPSRVPETNRGLSHAPNVRAVITSVGRPPIAGQETAAEHWFSLVYERAAFLAGALAAAGGLDQDQSADVDA